ncbi:MAG: flagellar biosynthetic protein FliQ [Alphaproteobacteria bacterium]|nr:flagellar biosynthetic protein FliQ [Alphaproteobacteria bacterium]
MTPDNVVGVAREMMTLALTLATPFLLGAVAASLLIGLFQAATRINDLTLSFVPRFLVVLLVLYAAASWAGGRMTASIERAAATAGHIRE